ncbi:MAG: prenyltransferase [Candidatus Baltobacteraceae bacterium]
MLVTLAAFARLSRPLFLGGGVLGGALGTAVAAFEGHPFAWGLYALAQTAISAFQLMTHYANDFFDRDGDRGGSRTLFSGGSGVLSESALRPRLALRAALAALAIGLLATFALAAGGRPLAAAFALATALGAWIYSAPPLRLVARGLGELDAVVVVGLLVPLCAYAAQAGVPTPLALAASAPGAAAMFGLMLAVELPDRAADEAAGKRTLIVRWDSPAVCALAIAGALGASAAGVALAVACGAPRTLAWAGVAGLGPGIALVVAVSRRAYLRPRGAALVAAAGVALFALVALAATLAFALRAAAVA